MIFFSAKLYTSSVLSNNKSKRLDNITIKYANLANFVALLGGKIKSEQMISGHMADILSNIYLAQSLIWYRGVPNVSPPLGGFTLASNAGSIVSESLKTAPLRGGS
jgi:hypothetical protein